MSLPSSPQGPPDQHIDDPEESLVEELLKGVDDELPQGDDKIEEEVERLQGDISMLQRLASSTSEATRAKCEEVAVKLKYRAVRILDQALHEETGDPTEKTSKLDDYFIGALEYGPDDPEGRKQYVGAILDEARLGLGSMRWIDGTCYQGEWTHDKSNGYGVETYTDGSVYRGQFSEDKRSGLGSWTDPLGTRYVGGWQAGEKHGSGIVMKLVGGEFKCALCTFEAGALKGNELVHEEDPRCAEVLQNVEAVVRDATQMAEAAKKLEAEVIVRPGTPKRRVSAPRIVPFQSKVVAIDEDTTSPQDANKNVESRKDPELYKPEDLAVKRDRYRLRMRGRGDRKSVV